MRAATAVRGTAPCPTTCRARTGATPNGRPSASQRQARDIGPNTEALILAVLARRPHPEQGFRTCLGVLRLFRGIDAARAEAVSLPRRRDRRADLRLRRLDPQTPARPDRRRRKPRTARPCCTTTSAAPATSIEENDLAEPSNTGSSARARPATAWPRAFRDLAANPESRALEHAEWLGLLVEQESHAAPAEAVRGTRAHRQAAPRRHGRGCRLPHAARPRPDAVPAPGQLRLDPRASALPHHRRLPAPASRGSPAHWATRPAARTCRSSTSAARGCSPPWRWRAATVATPG